MKPFFISLLLILINSCNTHQNHSTDKDSVIYNYEKITDERSSINPEAVKVYHEKVNISTGDELTVSLYETKNTFHYLVKIQYKNIRYKDLNETDTLKVPNFGINPSVEIMKGDKRPSCIIGFLDENKNFKESKLIYFEDGKLNVHVLKHYAVATYRESLK